MLSGKISHSNLRSVECLQSAQVLTFRWVLAFNISLNPNFAQPRQQPSTQMQVISLESTEKALNVKWQLISLSVYTTLPFSLFVEFVFAGLRLHLLHLDRVGLASTHVQLMVAHAQRQDALVDPQSLREKYEILQQ